MLKLGLKTHSQSLISNKIMLTTYQMTIKITEVKSIISVVLLINVQNLSQFTRMGNDNYFI